MYAWQDQGQNLHNNLSTTNVENGVHVDDGVRLGEPKINLGKICSQKIALVVHFVCYSRGEQQVLQKIALGVRTVHFVGYLRYLRTSYTLCTFYTVCTYMRCTF